MPVPRTANNPMRIFSVSDLLRIALTIASLASHLTAQTDVLTNRNDNNRTGANLTEDRLNTANVNPSQFGFLFSYQVEGNIFAQPLLVSGVQKRNVLYVATSNNVLYAFNADDVTQNKGLIWKDCFAASTPVNPVTTLNPCPPPASFITDKDPVYDGVFEGSIGITGTPVVDRARGTLYLVTRSKDSGKYEQSLHAVDIATGTERPGSPRIVAQEPISDPSSSKYPTPTTSFAAAQNQRAGLALAGNRVVVAWGGGTREGDTVTGSSLLMRYRGFVIAFDAVSLNPTGCFAAMGDGGSDASDNGTHGAAIWQSGRAPVIDQDGYVYYQTGNTMQGPDSTPDPCEAEFASAYPGIPSVHKVGIANSLIKLDVKGGVNLADHTAPQQYRQVLDDCDLDLSGSGPLLVPGTSTLIGGGKQGFLHVFEKREGKYFEKSSRQVYDGPIEQYIYSPDDQGKLHCQVISPCGWKQGCHHIMSGPVYWDSALKGKLIYVSAENDPIKAFRFESGQLWVPYDDYLAIPVKDLPIDMRTSKIVVGHPGANLSLSAHGNMDGTGILWAVHSLPHPGQDFFRGFMAGILRAYDAQNLSHELWNSELCPDDKLGNFPKFTPPTIANGRVYMATFSNKVMVYGPRSKPANCHP